MFAKFDAMFDATNSDGNGYINWQDYERLVDRFLSAYKIDKADERAQKLVHAYISYWADLEHRTTHSDDGLDREQFRLANFGLSRDTDSHYKVEGIAEAVFGLMAADGGNSIGPSEFRGLAQAWSLDEKEASWVFHELDTDGDSQISRSEFVRAVREFFTSVDPNIPGRLILVGRRHA